MPGARRLMPLWWLSYVNEQTGESAGVVIVRAQSFLGAAARARRLELSPGGQVSGVELPADEEHRVLAHENRLIPPEEARRLAEE